jgi:hypothetical protein
MAKGNNQRGNKEMKKPKKEKVKVSATADSGLKKAALSSMSKKKD